MSHRQMGQLLYGLIASLWLAYCFIGTGVGINYHTDWPIAPQIWQGIGMALLPTSLGYLTLFHLIPWLAESFSARNRR
jgi:hypothetical protein